VQSRMWRPSFRRTGGSRRRRRRGLHGSAWSTRSAACPPVRKLGRFLPDHFIIPESLVADVVASAAAMVSQAKWHSNHLPAEHNAHVVC